MKARLLAAPYEICLHRARCFTAVYRETEGRGPALRHALAFERTLATQRIAIHPDERLVGGRTEKVLAAPLPVERGEFLRILQLELDVLENKRRPFAISDADRTCFREEILPFWAGRTLRDHKAEAWAAAGLIATRARGFAAVRAAIDGARFLLATDGPRRAQLLGAHATAPPSLRRLRTVYERRHELAHNNPTPATCCFDVQGHLVLGVDRAVREGLGAIARRAGQRLWRLRRERPDDHEGADFLRAVVCSLHAAMAFSERYAALAEQQAAVAEDPVARERLLATARRCRRVPRGPARTFRDALQSLWLTQVVAEIQYGAHDVLAVGRLDQFLYPLFARDLSGGRLTREEAVVLLQELFLQLSANVEPLPEAGMDANGVLGNSQHTVTLGGLTPDGRDAVNELSWLCLEAYERLGGVVNQLAVRVHRGTDEAFLRRAIAVFRRTNGIAFYGDETVVDGLVADGLAPADARDYAIVGCVETCGQANAHPCPAGHDVILPAVLWMALSGGTVPAPAPGQRPGARLTELSAIRTFEDLVAAVERQLCDELCGLVRAIAAKDRAHRDELPAPFVSALLDDCIDRARDMTAGGARYDFTSVTLQGLATTVDSLLAVRDVVFERGACDLPAMVAFLRRDFHGDEELRRQLTHRAGRFGDGRPDATGLAARLVRTAARELARHRNVRGGRFRLSCFSYGIHVTAGLLLPATPDGRRAGVPISNGVSPSNLAASETSVPSALRAAAGLPAGDLTAGVALNLRFHPSAVGSDASLAKLAALLRTYFQLGGQQLQPNVVSAATLRDAQRHPERHRDLIVKVSGYSAYFTDVGRAMQDDIIARCEHGDVSLSSTQSCARWHQLGRPRVATDGC